MEHNPHILLVDDDPEILDLLSDYLDGKGFRTSQAADTTQARDVLSHDPADLVVLDLMLPGESGIDFCRTLRGTTPTSVIMLTALGETIDRIVGLEVGADDYLPKPFDPRELVSRIRAVLRRAKNAAGGATVTRGWRFAGWRLDRVARSLEGSDGRPVDLSGAEYRVLDILLANAGRVLSRGELTEALRGREHDPFDRSIDVRISRLRQLLGDDARAPNIIKTIYGEGYTLGVDVVAD